MKPKILFVSNKRSVPYTGKSGKVTEMKLASGLVNSINFVVEMLQSENIEASYVQVTDQNSIDKEVHHTKPTHVIIEALWVTPAKLRELCKLHPKTKWIIRLHSEVPFLANEGIAFEWLFEYIGISNEVFISTNSLRLQDELDNILKTEAIYLPNYYHVNNKHKKHIWEDNLNHHINIGCFGAIRPMKNQLMQAIAAITFCDEINKTLHFHININREETGGNSVLKNIRNLFKNTKHKLVEHPWTNHEEFVEIIKKIDIGMQVSFSETYNIVAADLVNCEIPIVSSPEIQFIHDTCRAKPTSCKDIVSKLHYVNNNSKEEIAEKNKKLLKHNSEASVEAWLKAFKKH